MGLIIYINTEKIQKPQKMSITKQKVIIEENNITTVAQKEIIQAPLNPQYLSQKKQKKSEDTKNQRIYIYKSISLEEAKLHHKPRPSIVPISAMTMTNHSNLSVGDKLILPNIEGFDYEVIISYITAHNDGSKSITGAFSDEGISYTTTMTKDSTESFISLATPQGAYEIETIQGIGYIYRTHDIRKHLHPFPKDDGIILNLSPRSDTIK